VAAVIEPSRDGKNGGGSGGTIFDDNGATLGRTPYIADKRVKIPVVVAAIESYGRLYRLTQAHAPVSVEINVDTKVHRRARARLRHGCRDSRAPIPS
jgi:carboxypeptidase Q